ncbi:MAG: nitrite reductase large subunit NirB, partial [Candidatus Hydrogenedentes bacterium]|nr:nitrite reductase large subunit NirB [Candidatus Hydrogenedentota bacterium]
LEAAKAVVDLGLEVHVVEFASRLMPRQLDDAGSELLVREIEALGVEVLLQRQTKRIEGNGAITGLTFTDNASLDTDMLIISAGIRPRDELARKAGLALGDRGGVVVDDTMRTSDTNIFAIGELALHDGMIYGLVGPGYQMADTLAQNLTGEDVWFRGADMSTKLKLMGVDVASLGSVESEGPSNDVIVVKDTVNGIYKKIILSEDHTQLLGGILVGDTSDYAKLLHTYRSLDGIIGEPQALLLGRAGDSGEAGVESLPDEAQVCSCNNVSKGDICKAIRAYKLSDLGDVQSATCAGTGCGGCVPMVKDLLTAEFKRAGITIEKTICEHFHLSRQELFQSVKVKKLRTFPAVLAEYGRGGEGCEVCKPLVASILASLWNEHIVEHAAIQDTNDRYLANIQRGGTYSVIPRVPGGEITPDKLIVLGEVAKKYDLYCKITGGQRVSLLGARVEELPDIWEELIAAGFESGHAYGKALRTVKSCVGQTWCRFGVQDSTRFAITLEERYRGIRSPHKIKFAVSGCVRECAEAQCKDVGLIATEKGWNLYICGNGGAKPRHADLFAADLDDETAIKYIDRFLMYYIHTADPLQRTSVWLEKLEDGLEHVKRVVIEDSLGLCETLEADMARLVDSYKCEWAEVVNNPEKRDRFRHFANTDEADPAVAFVKERKQKRPADWPVSAKSAKSREWSSLSWWKAGRAGTFPKESGMTVAYDGVQLAVFRYGQEDQWYATQNMCPHKQDMVLSRGLLGEKDGTPKVACPLHKKQF